MHTTNNVKEYNILPLDIEREEEWMTLFEFNQEYSKTSAKNSYNRTMDIVGKGLEDIQQYLEGLPAVAEVS